MVYKDPSYKVKNTFLEVSFPDDHVEPGKRRTRSDVAQHNMRASPLVLASKSPNASPSLHPVDETMQAVPIDEVDFSLLEEAAPAGSMVGGPACGSRFEPDSPAVASTPNLGRDGPAYIVPTTPSPFLHSAFPPSNVPPFGYGCYGMLDGGLPPAFDDSAASMDQGYMGDADGNFANGMQFFPDMYNPNMQPYDPSCGGYHLPYGWMTIPMDGNGNFHDTQQADGLGSSQQEEAKGSWGDADRDWRTPDSQRQSHDDLQLGRGGIFIPRLGENHAEMDNTSGALTELVQADLGLSLPRAEVEAPPVEEPPERVKEGRRGKGRNRGEAKEEKVELPLSGPDEGEGHKNELFTTVMLRNIPNKYTREMLIKQLSIDFKGHFDFMYLPIDFKNKCNVGYGFINFRTTEACERFVEQFNGVDVRKCLPGLNSKKVVEVTPARVQGLSENVRRLRNSPVMNQLVDHPNWMPLLFNENGEQEPFPQPDQPLPPVKPRGRAREGGSATGEVMAV
uniref:RRM domain-containing protein n=1 Tax=Noctiluca scintillans TaxID=2966 RepID=A0A7S1F403_NOCSC|mmetsp:Transcript_32476/g.87195  ORF Transcript_32476/g.87195 Transcript_32476/m.87195 type:complete len:507 (+) Transcript_32476:217-1737(+)|eukprot:CAMPEP_0194485270 /NCGR_PEP_ID=MMETSP0253-20130528/6326_1 /TAXON_ID=2966 /ORGANISM="Noctiluca scintillans" /LENGTH=506 /DNA_ID=CAMNT_0039325227 /DNA_START=85 /DNA_END=1605 /DNA_ORIENTATION=+